MKKKIFPGFFFVLISAFAHAGADHSFSVFQDQTPLRIQHGPRCTIFSVTALFESFFKKKLGETHNFSEDWVYYIAVADHFNRTGIPHLRTRYFTAEDLIKSIVAHGLIEEGSFPSLLMGSPCEHLDRNSNERSVCEDGKLDPRLITENAKDIAGQSRASGFYKKKAQKLLDEANHFRNYLENIEPVSIADAPWQDEDLKSGIRFSLNPRDEKDQLGTDRKLKDHMLSIQYGVVAELHLFAGAWNGSPAARFDMIPMPHEEALGKVGYPKVDTVDRKKPADKERPIHSVLIVGFDDDRILEAKVKYKNPLAQGKMVDNGILEKVSYQGVYFFKNSWEVFGDQFTYNGVAYPGFGEITQKYINEFAALTGIRERK